MCNKAPAFWRPTDRPSKRHRESPSQSLQKGGKFGHPTHHLRLRTMSQLLLFFCVECFPLLIYGFSLELCQFPWLCLTIDKVRTCLTDVQLMSDTFPSLVTLSSAPSGQLSTGSCLTINYLPRLIMSNINWYAFSISPLTGINLFWKRRKFYPGVSRRLSWMSV